MSSFDPSRLDDDRPVPPASAIHAEYCGDAATLRPHLTAAGPRAVLDYWEALRGTRRMPPRAAFNPMAVRQHLPNIFMLERADDGSWRYRVVGSVISEFFGVGNPVGMTPEDIFGANADGALRPLGMCRDRRAPCMHTASASWIYCDRHYVHYTVLLVPFGESDAEVDKVLCCAEFVSEEEAASA